MHYSTKSNLDSLQQRRDNLVLQCIINHAYQHVGEVKVLLTDDSAFWKNDEQDGNPLPAKQALLDAGIQERFTLRR